MTESKTSEGAIVYRNSIIPDHLIEQIKHWSQWINRKEKRIFLIVDSYDAMSSQNPTDVDFVWLLEQGVRNPDGSRKTIKFETEKFVELITSGQLEFIDIGAYLKTNL